MYKEKGKYRKETLVTGGKDFIVLVCKEEGGKSVGIENFKIFSKSDLAVDVGFTLKKGVATTAITLWDRQCRPLPPIYRTYYVVDLEEKKLFRVVPVSNGSRFPKRFSKRALILARYTDAEFSVFEKDDELRVQGVVDDWRLNDTGLWINEENMPGAIHVVDFSKKKVHKLNQVIFLN